MGTPLMERILSGRNNGSNIYRAAFNPDYLPFLTAFLGTHTHAFQRCCHLFPGPG